MTDYLTVIEALAIQIDQIERYGGTQGVRDRGLLEAALYRPQTGYYGDLIEEAAALWESLGAESSFHRRQQADCFRRNIYFSSHQWFAAHGGFPDDLRFHQRPL